MATSLGEAEPRRAENTEGTERFTIDYLLLELRGISIDYFLSVLRSAYSAVGYEGGRTTTKDEFTIDY